MKDLYKAYLRYIGNHSSDCLSRQIIFDVPYDLLRKLNKPSMLRPKGAFFSGDAVTRQLLEGVRVCNQPVFDPAAGCGDLLLRYFERQKVNGRFGDVLSRWERMIFAVEKESSFVKTLKLRMWLLLYWKIYGEVALSSITIPSLDDRFLGVRCGDGLAVEGVPDGLILMNPPYQQVKAKKTYPWSAGKVSYAAIFLCEMVKKYPRSRLLAILPDVLRSGSRYGRLRAELAGRVAKVKIFGRFDDKTDVDVFTMDSGPMRGRRRQVCQNGSSCGGVCLGDYFEVHVGAVVPHRDKYEGEQRAFLNADNLPAGGCIDTVRETLLSEHAPVCGPFVVLRRTSSPADRIRCVSTVIMSTAEFHLDNHLIYVKPKKSFGALNACLRVHKYFQSQACTDRVNHLIRCRHLTVGIVSGLPYTY